MTLQGEGRDLRFEINAKFYDCCYLLAYGIYPPWSCFVQTIYLRGNEEKKMTFQGARSNKKRYRADIWYLQRRFAIIANPWKQWSMNTITDIMFACVVLHNIILNDEKYLDIEDFNLRRSKMFPRGLTLDLMLRTGEVDTHYSFETI